MSFQTPQVAGLKVLDEGITIANPANSMNFVGAGVTGTVSGSDVTETISGGASGTNTATEKLTPTTSGTSITLDLTALSHTFTAIQGVWKNGQLLDPADATYGWSRSVNTITALNAANTDIFLIQYNY